VEGDSLRWYAEWRSDNEDGFHGDGRRQRPGLGHVLDVRRGRAVWRLGRITSVFPAKFAVASIAGVPPQKSQVVADLPGSQAVAAGDSVFLALSSTQPSGLALLAGGSLCSSARSCRGTRRATRRDRATAFRTSRTGSIATRATDVRRDHVDCVRRQLAFDQQHGRRLGRLRQRRRIDLYVSTSGNVETGNVPNWLYRNDGDGTFTEVAAAEGVWHDAGLTDGACWADVNGDGFLDLFVDNGAEHPPFGVGPRELFVNPGNANHWIEVQLRGIVSNGSGIGARVRFVTGASVQWRWRLGESDNCFSDQTTLHAGLAAATSVDSLQVLWPSGAVDSYAGLAAYHRYWAIEGQALHVLGDPRLSASPDTVTARRPERSRDVRHRARQRRRMASVFGSMGKRATARALRGSPPTRTPAGSGPAAAEPSRCAPTCQASRRVLTAVERSSPRTARRVRTRWRFGSR
jgi:hypothetical protein